MAITASDGALTVFTIGICVSCIIGVLISFPALLPLLRNLGRHEKTLRIAEIVIFGLLSFTLTFGLWTRMSVYWTRVVSGGIDSAGFNELWIRRMIPPPLRRSCYTSQTTVCEATDEALSRYHFRFEDPIEQEQVIEREEQKEYLARVFLGLTAAATSSTIAWFLTQKAQPEQPT